MELIKAVKNIESKIIKWRQDLHSIPGIDFDLVDTYNYVKKALEEMNIPYITLAKTGICALIEGREKGSTIALRADMDGLLIKEETGLGYASKNDCMHACGHDAHMAMLLGVACILTGNKDKLKGNVKLIFQPAEENLGGAKPMIEEGCLDNPKVDRVLGLHIGQLFSEVKGGMLGFRKGAAMASVDKFIVKVKGKGGHGATPHLCVDPITIASEMVLSLQKIISREVNPIYSSVLTIGIIKGGTAFNIIPEWVEFQGTVRTVNSEERIKIQNRIHQICESIANANRAEAEVEYLNKYPVLVNDDKFTEQIIKSAEKVLSKDKIVMLNAPGMISEDMAYYLEKVPGTFFFLGSNNESKGIMYPHHHPKFNVDEEVLWIGTAVLAQSVFDFFDLHP